MTNPQPDPEQEYIVLEHELSNIERYPYDPVIRQVTFKAIRYRLHSDSDKVLDEIFHRLCQLKGAEIFSSVDFGEIMNVYADMKKELRQNEREP